MSPTSILLILTVFTALMVFLAFRIIEALHRIADRIGSMNTHVDELRTEVSVLTEVLANSLLKMRSRQEDVVSSIEAVEDELKGGNIYSDNDSMYEKAKQLVIREGKASASLLQRRLVIGYARASWILDKLQDEGVIGPADGSRPRGVLQ